jgi:hypothetical protein
MIYWILEYTMGEIINRTLHHKPGAVLNVMTLELSKGIVGAPHYNVDRDEVVFILRGSVDVLQYNEELKIESITTLSPHGQSWIMVKSGKIHRFEVKSESAELLEVLGGSHFVGACICVDSPLSTLNDQPL